MSGRQGTLSNFLPPEVGIESIPEVPGLASPMTESMPQQPSFVSPMAQGISPNVGFERVEDVNNEFIDGFLKTLSEEEVKNLVLMSDKLNDLTSEFYELMMSTASFYEFLNNGDSEKLINGLSTLEVVNDPDFGSLTEVEQQFLIKYEKAYKQDIFNRIYYKNMILSLFSELEQMIKDEYIRQTNGEGGVQKGGNFWKMIIVLLYLIFFLNGWLVNAETIQAPAAQATVGVEVEVLSGNLETDINIITEATRKQKLDEAKRLLEEKELARVAAEQELSDAKTAARNAKATEFRTQSDVTQSENLEETTQADVNNLSRQVEFSPIDGTIIMPTNPNSTFVNSLTVMQIAEQVEQVLQTHKVTRSARSIANANIDDEYPLTFTGMYSPNGKAPDWWPRDVNNWKSLLKFKLDLLLSPSILKAITSINQDWTFRPEEFDPAAYKILFFALDNDVLEIATVPEKSAIFRIRAMLDNIMPLTDEESTKMLIANEKALSDRQIFTTNFYIKREDEQTMATMMEGVVRKYNDFATHLQSDSKSSCLDTFRIWREMGGFNKDEIVKLSKVNEVGMQGMITSGLRPEYKIKMPSFNANVLGPQDKTRVKNDSPEAKRMAERIKKERISATASAKERQVERSCELFTAPHLTVTYNQIQGDDTTINVEVRGQWQLQVNGQWAAADMEVLSQDLLMLHRRSSETYKEALRNPNIKSHRGSFDQNHGVVLNGVIMRSVGLRDLYIHKLAAPFFELFESRRWNNNINSWMELAYKTQYEAAPISEMLKVQYTGLAEKADEAKKYRDMKLNYDDYYNKVKPPNWFVDTLIGENARKNLPQSWLDAQKRFSPVKKINFAREVPFPLTQLQKKQLSLESVKRNTQSLRGKWYDEREKSTLTQRKFTSAKKNKETLFVYNPDLLISELEKFIKGDNNTFKEVYPYQQIMPDEMVAVAWKNAEPMVRQSVRDALMSQYKEKNLDTVTGNNTFTPVEEGLDVTPSSQQSYSVDESLDRSFSPSSVDFGINWNDVTLYNGAKVVGSFACDLVGCDAVIDDAKQFGRASLETITNPFDRIFWFMLQIGGLTYAGYFSMELMKQRTIRLEIEARKPQAPPPPPGQKPPTGSYLSFLSYLNPLSYWKKPAPAATGQAPAATGQAPAATGLAPANTRSSYFSYLNPFSYGKKSATTTAVPVANQPAPTAVPVANQGAQLGVVDADPFANLPMPPDQGSNFDNTLPPLQRQGALQRQTTVQPLNNYLNPGQYQPPGPGQEPGGRGGKITRKRARKIIKKTKNHKKYTKRGKQTIKKQKKRNKKTYRR